MRFDAVLIDQSAEHLGRAISAVAHELGRIEIEALHRSSIMCLAASTSACRIAVVASTSTMIALSRSIK